MSASAAAPAAATDLDARYGADTDTDIWTSTTQGQARHSQHPLRSVASKRPNIYNKPPKPTTTLLRSATTAPKDGSLPPSRQQAQQPRSTQHNTDRGAEGPPQPRSTTTSNQEHRNNTTATDPREKGDGKSRSSEKPTATWASIAKALLFFITWVLISTNTLCGYTHHTSPPTISPTAIPTIHCPTLKQPPTRYHPDSYVCRTLKPLPLSHTTLPILTRRQIAPPPHSIHTPVATTSPPAPTTHKHTHKRVSKDTRTHQHSHTYTTTRNAHNQLNLSLPPSQCRRRSSPPPTTKSQPSAETHKGPPKNNQHSELPLPQATQPEPTTRHPHGTHSPKTDRQTLTFPTTLTEIPPKSRSLTLTHPQTDHSHQNSEYSRTARHTTSLTNTQPTIYPTTHPTIPPHPTHRRTLHNRTHHTSRPKTDPHDTHPLISHSVHHWRHPPNCKTRHTPSHRRPPHHTTHHTSLPKSNYHFTPPTIPHPARHWQHLSACRIQPTTPPKANAHTPDHSTISRLTPWISHRRSHNPTAPPAKQYHHLTNLFPRADTIHTLAQCTKPDYGHSPHPQHTIQIPLHNPLFLTHSPTIPLHTAHTAMAPNNGTSHTAPHTRSIGIDSRTRTKGGNSTRSYDMAAPNNSGRGGDEGAASLEGAGTRSRNSGRRRALITEYSDDEERENSAPPPSQPVILKEKATPSQDFDIDMQLEGVSPAHGGSSLQLSTSHNEYAAIPNQAAISTTRLDIINLADATPKSPRKEAPSDTQSAKRRRSTTSLSASKSQHEKTMEDIPSIDIVSHMWLGFPIHEAIATHWNKEVIREHRTNEEFTKLGTPTREIIEFKTLRRAFPHVPQAYFPHERPDAVPGNHLHFTQIPSLEKIDSSTGLSEGFHITIRYDFGFKSISRQEARRGCMERLRLMEIPLGTTYSNPIDIGINAVTKNWAGFIKVHLLHPRQDGIALLQGNRAFVMEMEDGVKVIGKVEKGFELVTKARNLRLYIKGETLRHTHAFHIFEEIVRESYYTGRQHEFMGLTKPEFDKPFAFLTLTTEEARDTVIREGLTFNHEKLHVSVTRDRGNGNPSELRISTTLVANNLPQRESQASITKAIKLAFGADNIVGVSFGNNPHADKQAGWCHIQCLNAAVYTEWLHKSTFILGRRIDFIPHHGSIDGSDPNNTAIRLAQAPAREAIAEKIQAMSNVTNSNPILTERYLTKTMKEFEDKLDEKFGTLTTTINTNTDRRHEHTTATITHHTNNLQTLFGTIAHEIQQSNLRMQGLVNGLATAAPEI